MKLLAIDVSSTVMAHAFGEKRGKITDASWFRPHGEIYARLNRIRSATVHLVSKVRPDAVFIEAPIPMASRGGTAVTFACYGAAAVCAEACRAVLPSVSITMEMPNVWRKRLVGKTKKGMAKPMTRDHILKLDPSLIRFLDDDEGFDVSDACGLWLANQ